MKKYFFYLCIFISTSVFGQGFKNQILVGGSALYNTKNKDLSEDGISWYRTLINEKTTRFGIMPSVGYGVTDNIVVGIGVNHSTIKVLSTYSYNEEKFQRLPTFPDSLYYQIEGDYKLRTSSYEAKEKCTIVNVYATYYKSITNKLYFSATLGVGYGKLKIKQEEESFFTSPEVKKDVWSVKLIPSINYDLANKVLIYLNIGSVDYTSFKDADENQQSKDEQEFNVKPAPSEWSFGMVIRLNTLNSLKRQ